MIELGKGDFVGFFGQPRAGKTMGAIALMYGLWKDKGMQVYSNTPLAFPSVTIRSVQQLMDIQYRDPNTTGILFVDEVHTLLDSRSFSSSFITPLTRWFMLIGKMGLLMVYTSQTRGMVDIRIRSLTHYWIDAKKAQYGLSYLNWYYVPEPATDDPERIIIKQNIPLVWEVWQAIYDTNDRQVDLISPDNDVSLTVLSEYEKLIGKQQHGRRSDSIIKAAQMLVVATDKESKTEAFNQLKNSLGGN